MSTFRRLVLLLSIVILGSLPGRSQSVQSGANIPDWAEKVIWYQIFPERFNNGDTLNDPVVERIGDPYGWDLGGPEDWEISPWTGDWYQRAAWEQRVGPSFYDFVFSRRYGGDLQGVIDKLDYLAELGVTGIYFNPVFDAVSLHKYDASYYHHIDRHFGPDPEGDMQIIAQEDPSDPSTWQWTSADRLFLSLIEEAKKRGIRIIIDGVWNHTGRDFWAFRHIREHGQDSPFTDWYKISNFNDSLEDGFDYEGWWGYKGLPEFREQGEDLHPEVKEHIFAVTRRWMAPDGDVSKGVDGWRLDVAEELGLDFWRDWHELVFAINPQALTVAEIWGDAAKEYVGDELFGIVMNYRWANATHDFFILESISADEFAERLKTLLDEFPLKVNQALQNLMDSHDTERLASMIVNKNYPYKENSKIREPGSEYEVRAPNDDEIRLQKLISLFQYTWVGAPMIFYGTEAGMWGADDPDDRKPMIWPELEYAHEINHPFSRQRPQDPVSFDHGLFRWYRFLADIRNSSPALQAGDYNIIKADKKLFAFIRQKDEDVAVVIVNSGDSEEIIDLSETLSESLFGSYKDVVSGKNIIIKNGSAKINIPPVSGMILRP